MLNLMHYFADFYQYSKDCGLLLSPFASCTSFWGILYFILAIFLAIGFIKVVALIYPTRPHSLNPDKTLAQPPKKNAKESQQWQDSAFAEFSHERILQKFHKELNEK